MEILDKVNMKLGDKRDSKLIATRKIILPATSLFFSEINLFKAFCVGLI